MIVHCFICKLRDYTRNLQIYGNTIFILGKRGVVDLVSNRQESSAVIFVYRHGSRTSLWQWSERLIKALEGQANTEMVDRLGFGIK